MGRALDLAAMLRQASPTTRRQVLKLAGAGISAPALLALLARDGAVASRAALLAEVWGYDRSVTSRTVDGHVAGLRQKLEADPRAPRHLLTVYKAGYRLER